MPSMPGSNARTHQFHATTDAISGSLRMPLEHQIEPQAPLTLDQAGGHKSLHTGSKQIHGVISYQSAYSQVSGNRNLKEEGGWVTLSTSVIAGLNIMDVLTAERIVAQIVTTHPQEGYVPKVSLLGTRFENLRINGHPVEVDVDLDVLGAKPAGDVAYTAHEPLVERVEALHGRVIRSDGAPAEVVEQYTRLSRSLREGADSMELNLVKELRVGGPFPASFPGSIHGHVIRIPDFGTLTLGKLVVRQEDFHPEAGTPRKTTVELVMIEGRFGCAIEGVTSVGGPANNGATLP